MRENDPVLDARSRKVPPAAFAFAALLSIVLFWSRPARCDEARFPLLEAVDCAITYYPTIAVSAASRDAAGAALGLAEADKYPVFSLGGALTHYQEPMVVFPIHAFTPNQTPPFDRTLYQVFGELSYTLFDGGARSSRIAGSQADEKGAEALLDGAGQSLLSLVVGAYLQGLGDVRALEAHDHSIAALESEHARVLQLFDVGRAARIETLRVEAAIASARAERVAVASSLDRAERNLARLTGTLVEDTRARRLVPVSLVQTSLPSREELREKALSASPTIRAAQQRHGAAESDVTAARSGRFPDVRVNAAYVNYASFSGMNQLEWNVGLRVAYPLFTGGAVSSSIARAEANARRVAEEVRLATLEVEQGLDRALSGIDEADARLRSLTTAMRSLEEVARIERLSLETGTGTQTDYLRAEADLLASRAERIRAEYGVIFAHTELARATGQLSREWLLSHLRRAP